MKRPTSRPSAGKAPSTKDRLMDAGEHLFGKHGFDGISLREIAAAAGQANNNVVQYHFANKEGLIAAILKDRVERIEALRCEQLAQFKAGGGRDARTLLEILWLPSMSLRGADGGYVFCRFLLQYMLQPGIAPHPVLAFYDSGGAAKKPDPNAGGACAAEAAKLLRLYYKGISDADFARRLSALTMMFLSAVVEFDNARPAGKARSARAFGAGPILDMSVAALAAPAAGRR